MTHCPDCQSEVGPYDQKCGKCGRGLSGKHLLAGAQTAATAPSGTTRVLVLLAVVVAVLGALSLSNATAGVGGLAMACFLGICARIAQAAHYHNSMIKAVADSRR